jgi:hypothetical protein
MKVTNKMQRYRLIFFSLSALHVSGDVFAHHQEEDCIYNIWYYSRRLLPVGVLDELKLLCSRQQPE